MPVKIDKRALARLEASRAAHERGLLEICARVYLGAHRRAYAAEPATILQWIIAELRGTEQAEQEVCQRGAALVRALLTQDTQYCEIERFLLHRYAPAELDRAIIATMRRLGMGMPIDDLLRALDDADLTDNPTAAAAIEALGVKRGILQEQPQCTA